MRKLIAAINMTIDGFCDHSVITPDEEIHQHYADLLSNADTVLYGRITYQLMEYWQTVMENPTGKKPTDDFAVAIDRIPKIVFSRTLKKIEWETARLAKRDIEDEIRELKKQPGKDIFVCSPSLIVTSTQLGLIDEYQLCVHPIVAGSGLSLFKDLHEKIVFKLIKTKTLGAGAVILYYEPAQNL
jgi:Dihydrofolate reductase